MMPKAGRIDDVHLGVAEDPEQVLPQQRVGAGADVEEVGVEVPLEQQQEQRHGDDRDGEQQQELGDEGHPGEDRHLHQRHAGCPHVEHGDDQVDAPTCEAMPVISRPSAKKSTPLVGENGTRAVRGVHEPAAVGAARRGTTTS
jgi:hypothetical protein